MADDALDASQYVLRRVHRNHLVARNPIRIDGIAAFRPTPGDKDGLSVSYEAEITAEDLASIGGKAAEEYAVVRFSVDDLKSLGLSVVRDDDRAAPPGHAFIPQMNFVDYQDRARKTWIKDRAADLADLAACDIVLEPPD